MWRNMLMVTLLLEKREVSFWTFISVEEKVKGETERLVVEEYKDDIGGSFIAPNQPNRKWHAHGLSMSYNVMLTQIL